jgi:hypothetical protein
VADQGKTAGSIMGDEYSLICFLWRPSPLYGGLAVAYVCVGVCACVSANNRACSSVKSAAAIYVRARRLPVTHAIAFPQIPDALRIEGKARDVRLVCAAVFPTTRIPRAFPKPHLASFLTRSNLCWFRPCSHTIASSFFAQDV